MRNSEKEVNELYAKIFTNTPKRLEITIPDYIGEGKAYRTVTKRGIILSTLYFEFPSGIEIRNNTSEDFIYIWFNLGEDIYWDMESTDRQIILKHKQAYCTPGAGENYSLHFEKNKKYHLRCLKIPTNYFYKLIATYFNWQEIDTYGRDFLRNSSFVSLTPRMEQIFYELKEYTQFQNGMGYLFLECKIHEMISIYMAEALKMETSTMGKTKTSQINAEMVLRAKEIIDNQLAYVPSRSQLAKEVGMSTSLFSKTFTDVLGMSVHAYIINKRLEKAASLLLESEMTIKEICMEVGYSKSSNFAAAFKRKFGMNPTTYRTQMTDGSIIL